VDGNRAARARRATTLEVVAFEARRPTSVSAAASVCYAASMGSSAESSLLAVQSLAHLDALYAFALRLCRDGGLAEDLVQETFARCLDHAASFEPGTNLKAWLFRILRNLFFDQRRRERRDEPLGERDAPPLASAAYTESELERVRGLVAQDIDAALRALPEEQRAVVLLDLEGFSEREIAGIAGCAAGTVKSRLARARAALRGQLKEYAK
jgi:RNA polymerase sigma-70 factor (ECF subfamily)